MADLEPLGHGPLPLIRTLSGDIDLVTPTQSLGESTPSSEPSLNLSTLAAGLDSTTSIPEFLNSLLPYPSSLSSSSSSSTARKGYIPPPDLPGIDKSLQEIITLLSLLSQDTSSSLEQSIRDISRTVPRLTYDLQFMRESAVDLQTQLGMVQGRVGRGSNGSLIEGEGAKTNKSLEKLSHLDKLKTRMESARDVLREAESWSTLESEILGDISQKAWSKAGNRLSEAAKSLVVFQATPGEYDTRKGLLVSLTNQLETDCAGALISALREGKTVEIATFGKIFGQMDRAVEFRNYYYNEQRREIVSMWEELRLYEQGGGDVSGGGGERFSVSFLAKWYALILRIVTEEKNQIPKVFGSLSASGVLGTFISTTIESLQPPLQSRLSNMVENLGDTALPELIRAYKATEELVGGIHGTMEKIILVSPLPTSNDALPSPSPLSASTPTSSKIPISPLTSTSTSTSTTNRPIPSKRSSVLTLRQNSLPTSTSSIPSKWETSLLEPFLDLQNTYPILEKRYLKYLLSSDHALTSTRKDAASLSERSLVVFNLANEALGRCQALTHGYGSIGMLEAVGEFIFGFFEAQSDLMVYTPTSTANPSGSTGNGTGDELDFDSMGMDYTTEDWAAFQAGLHILKICRDISTRLRGFEERVHTYLEGCLKLPSPNSNNSTVVISASTIVSSSPLNSAALHTLLSSKLTKPIYPLVPARKGLTQLTSTSQISLQNIILSPLRNLLATYPTLGIWTQSEKPRRDGLSIPTFSLSPTDSMSRVAEGLLNLLRVFEVHANDDALAYSIDTLPYIESHHLPPSQGVTAQSPKTNGNGNGNGSPAPSTSTTITGLTHFSTSNTNATTTGGIEAETVISTWVSSLALTLLSHLTKKILPAIRGLSGSGKDQLLADLGYLSNAVRALDVEWEELEWWRGALDVGDGESWRRGLREKKEEGERDVWLRVGRLRGWDGR